MYAVSQLYVYLQSLLDITNIVISSIINSIKKKVISSVCYDNIAVLHHSEHFLVVDKPYDLLINSNNPEVQNSVHLVLRRMFPKLINPNLCHEFHFVHRLDFATSGVLCVALNKQSAKVASIAFEKRMVEKYYIALVHGHITNPSLIINVPIGEDIRELNGSHKMCTNDDSFCQKPRKALTALLVLELGYQNNKAITKVLLYPKTGRRHQLRVHCKYIGHTIVGDFTYSDKTDTKPYRTFLHALRLSIDNTIEHLNIQTVDPFPETNIKYQWKSVKIVRQLDESAFLDIKKLTVQQF